MKLYFLSPKFHKNDLPQKKKTRNTIKNSTFCYFFPMTVMKSISNDDNCNYNKCDNNDIKPTTNTTRQPELLKICGSDDKLLSTHIKTLNICFLQQLNQESISSSLDVSKCLFNCLSFLPLLSSLICHKNLKKKYATIFSVQVNNKMLQQLGKHNFIFHIIYMI